MPDSIPVIIDTDIGGDIDDAITLVYALQNALFDVQAVTTVGYNGEPRARIVQALMQSCGISAPIAIGNEPACWCETLPGQVRWAIEHLPPHSAPQYMPAAELIQQVVANNPGAVHLVCLGPLTNIAQAFLRYPQLPTQLAGLHIMGGELQTFRREHNFAGDYMAADQVLRTAHNPFLATWSVGAQIILDDSFLAQLSSLGTPVGNLLTHLIRAWYTGYNPVMYDIVPFLHLESATVVPSRLHKIRIETTGLLTRGVLVDMGKYATGLPLEHHTDCVPPGYAATISNAINVEAAQQMLQRTLLSQLRKVPNVNGLGGAAV